MAEEVSEKLDEANARDKALSKAEIDEEFMVRHAKSVLSDFSKSHIDFFDQREKWLSAARDLRHQWDEGPYQNSSDIHIPFIMMMAKGIHARLYEAFGQSQGFYSVEAISKAYVEREKTVKEFMDWVLAKYCNRGDGFKPVLDRWLDDLCYEGSAIFKDTWDVWYEEYKDLDYEVIEEEVDDLEVDEDGNVEVVRIPVTRMKIKNQKVSLDKAAPRIAAVPLQDFCMPPGHFSTHQAPWVAHRVHMTDEDLKCRARQGKFYKDAVEKAVQHRQVQYSNQTKDYHGANARGSIGRLEGISAYETGDQQVRYDTINHSVIEFYCKAYITDEVTDEDRDDINKRQQEIVFWYHEASDTFLGWTYLYRIAPDGKRPFHKADFMPARERSYGIGISELLYSINMYMDAMHQLKMDNGLLSSLQFGVYRASSTLKPDTFRVEPGELVPVEDPKDVQFTNFPYLGNFGEQEEQILNGYGEKLLPVNDISLGNFGAKGVAGALRNATGAAYVDRQSSIQLNPHLDRIALCIGQLLNSVFIMCRERMPNTLFYRVTGEDGNPIFGEGNRENLMGDFDFNIEVDIMGASDAEKQQRATLMIQTLLNPTWMQLGIVRPENFYEIIKNYLQAYGVRRIHKYITKPEGYLGPKLSIEEKVFRIISGNYNNPPIEKLVQLSDNHQEAIEYLQNFMNTDMFGLLGNDLQAIAAYHALMLKHQEMMQMMQNPNPMANASGTQMPYQGGLQGLQPGPEAAEGMVGQGPLSVPQGEVNGPVF